MRKEANMNFLSANWFLIFILLGCVGMHFFMHGHGDHEGHTRRGADPAGGKGLPKDEL